MTDPTTTPPTDPTDEVTGAPDPVRDSAPQNEPHDGSDDLPNPPITANNMQSAQGTGAAGSGGAGF